MVAASEVTPMKNIEMVDIECFIPVLQRSVLHGLQNSLFLDASSFLQKSSVEHARVTPFGFFVT